MKRIKKILLAVSLACLAGASSAALTACKEDEPTTYTYGFNTNGGNAIEDVTLNLGDEYVLPTPEREGYNFEGWYTTSDFTGEPVVSIVADANATYYAKWKQKPTITLDVNGGSLATTTIYLNVGENVYNAVKDLAPTKTGLMFGAWFNGNGELSQNTSMPEGGLTLTAKYKVEYTVEIFLQNMEGTDYEKKTETGYAYVGSSFTSEAKVTGFKEVEKDDTLVTKTLSENAAENVFKHYMDRQTFTVTFRPNYPENDEGTYTSEKVLYGKELEIPSDYKTEGYCLIGWSTSSTGSVEYKANYIQNALHNKDSAAAEPAKTFMPEKTMTLYGIWVKGYTDMFGGNDYIYIIEDKIYLARGDVFFEGEYDVEDKKFEFLPEDDKQFIEGHIYDDGTYSYYDAARDEYSAALYKVGTGLDENTKIYFGAYNEIEYEEYNGNEQKISKGTYAINREENYYEAIFTEGPKAGEKMVFLIGTVTLDNVKKDAFQVRNEEEYAMGELLRFAISGTDTVYYPNVYQITLNGFGTATYKASATQESQYYYSIEDDILTLSTGSSIFGVVRLVEFQGRKGYMMYTEEFDQTFTLASGATLQMNGAGEAVYTVDGKEISGYYSTTKSLLAGRTIIDFTAVEGTYKFLLTKTTEEVPVIGEGGFATEETETVTTYSIEEKLPTYAEYQYLAGGKVYSSLLLILDETEAGKATLYGMTEKTKVNVKVSEGKYVESGEEGFYVYTAGERFEEEELSADPIDPLKLKSFVFNTDNKATSYSIIYWKSSTDTEDATTEYVVDYTSADGATLQLIGGFAFLTNADGVPFVGAHATDENGITALINADKKEYVELNNEDHTFILLQYAPYSAYIINADGKTNRTEYVSYDGKGNATYVIVTPAENEEEEDVLTEYEGTVEDLDKKTAYDVPVSKFTSKDGTIVFEYIRLQTTSSSYVAKFNKTYNGTYLSDDGLLTLDGFSYMATFVDAAGNSYEGRYVVTGTDEIELMIEEPETTYYFDIKANGEFTVRGLEYRTYLLMDNQYMIGYVDLDGYNKASIYTRELKEGSENEYERVYIDENGTYEKDGDIYTLKYSNGIEQITLTGKLDYVISGGTAYYAFITIHSEKVRIYVNEADWSMLILDEIGKAVKYDNKGMKEEGTYTVITDSLLYYVNVAATDACIYKYDYVNGTIAPLEFNARGYYTANLESLLFSEYGFAIFNGETRYYYNIVDGNVTIYLQDPTNPEANDYGYVESSFGDFSNVKQYGGKTYYENSGFAIQFARAEATKDIYPVQLTSSDKTRYALEGLTFQPGSEEEFTVSGSVYINGKARSCYVTRARNDLGEMEMYITLSNYRFYIDVDYKGMNDDGSSNNTYEIVDMRFVQSVYSYRYLQMYYLFMAFIGMGLEDTYGMITINGEYLENGDVDRFYITAEFKEDSILKDMNGEIVSFEEATYGYNSKSKMYVAGFEAKDGNTYNLYFFLQYHQAFGLYGYTIQAFTRQQTLETADGYTVKVDRVMATDQLSVERGDVYNVSLQYNGETLPVETIMWIGGDIYCIARTRAEAAEGEIGKITSTKYYKVNFVEEEQDSSIEGGEGEETEKPVAWYKSATVEEETLTTLYDDEGKVYVDISDTRGITYIALYSASYIVTECTYDEATSTYRATTSNGRVFIVKVLGDYMEITEE